MSIYEELNDSQQFACRVIADHARSTAFAIADGILPGNEGRNYVLRKIMRRAIYHGREHLGLNDLFFYKVCDFVVAEMSDAYPELEAQRDFMGKMVRVEEERFGNTLTVGLKKLDEYFKEYFEKCRDQAFKRLDSYFDLNNDKALKILISTYNEERLLPLRNRWRQYWRRVGSSEDKPVPDGGYNSDEDLVLGEEAKAIEAPVNKLELIKACAKLYDTYGIPKDLILVTLRDRGFEFSEEEFDAGFDNSVQELQENSQIGKTRQAEKISPIYAVLERACGPTHFVGYETTQSTNVTALALVRDNERVNELKPDDEGLVVLEETPFYAEAGGQVGDTGRLTGPGNLTREQKLNVLLEEISETAVGFSAKVVDTFSPISGLILHKIIVEKGILKTGDRINAIVDVEKRDATRRNHTATHLVHAALREVLGNHVKQGGSVVAPNYLRFDFTHYQPLTSAEIQEIEDLVNRHILENHPVNTDVMAIEEAMHSGAMALFGEKYGSDVRVLSVGDGMFSKELCGGTHVRATGDIGSFKITSDEAIASGVRRIRAITGFDAFERFREDERLIGASLSVLKTQRDNLPNAIERLQEELKRTRKEMDELKLKIATGTIGNGGSAASNGDEARDIAGVKVLGKIVEGLDGNGTRQLSDTLLARLKSGVVILGRTDEGKVGIIVRVSDDLTGKVKAGDIIREIAPIVGGRGGGKADMAEGGGTEPDKLAEAIDASYKVIEKFLRR